MSTARSDGVYEKWRESTEKFDYFILGVLGALCAYISQTYKAERLGLNPGTLDLLALLVLVLAAVFGFRRIEAVNQGTLINHRVLHAYERRGVLASVTQNGSGINTQTGETYTPEYAASQIPLLSKQIEQLKPQLQAAQKRTLIHYQLRNGCTLVGFLMLLSAKLYSAYV
ncbi:hypothetical protein ACLIKD_11675 [Azonexus sp. IMCC34842]|uniref:hypothetical protein n=1 Tax=Azonexus sp. IMCC34842 TaxID=3420950 RepID=UPI003D14E49A